MSTGQSTPSFSSFASMARIVKDEITLFLENSTSKITLGASQYKILQEGKKISDISFSSVSPNILYILTHDDEIFRFEINALTLTRMTIVPYLKRLCCLVCHKDYVYITEKGRTIHKYAIENSHTLRQVSLCHTHRRNEHFTSDSVAISRIGLLYHCDGRSYLPIVNTHTMELQSSKYLDHYQYDMAIKYDQLHVATKSGIHIYTSDCKYTGESYLNGEVCGSVACTSHGYTIVGMKNKIAIVSQDLESTYYMQMSTPSKSSYHVRCGTIDNSIAIVDSTCSNVYLTIVSQEGYTPPFSLQTLCVSTIALHRNELPAITLLPPKLKELVQQ